MDTDVTDDDITIVDSTYNTKLKDAISEKFIRDVTHPNILMRILQKYNGDVLIDVDIDYVKTKLEKDGRMTANEALLDRLYRYKNWFKCLLQAVNDDSIKLGFLEKEFQACKDDLDEQILSETNEETTNSSRHPDYRIPVSQRRENLRLKLYIEKLKKQQDDYCKNFEVQMKELQKEKEKEELKLEVKELKEELGALTLCHEQLKNDFIQEKSSHDQLKIHVEAQANENMEREKKSTEIFDKRFQSLNMEKEELKSEVKLLTQELGALTLCHEQLKNESIQEKSCHDQLKIHVEAQAKENMEREKKSTEIFDKRLQSLNMEKEELKSEVKLLTQELALPTSLSQFLHLNPDTGTCYVSEQWKRIHHSGLTLLFIGLTGQGKSATGNTIMGRRAFKEDGGGRSRYDVGIECCKYKGVNLKLVDGPGYFDTENGDFFARFIANIGATLGHGVDVFIYVFQYDGRFTGEQQDGVKLLIKNFGADFFRNFVVFLFTRGDVFPMDHKKGESFSEYCSNLVGPEKKMIDECGGAVLFDNKTNDVIVKERQMESLLQLISKKISHRRLSDFKIPSEFNFKHIIDSPDENE